MLDQNLTDYFYNNIIGHSVSIAKEIATKATIRYLLESNVSEKEIKQTMMSYNDDVILPSNLPDKLWIVNPYMKEDKNTGEMYEVQDNLIKRNEFYYHPRLMLRSAMPKIVKGKEVIEPYYCEPVCRFTVQDLIDYFCNKIQTHKVYMNTRYSVNSIWQNMRIFKNVSKVIEPLDIMLFSIDCAARNGNYHFSTFMQLQQYLEETVEDLKTRMAYMQAYGFDKIVWRADIWLSQNLE